MELTERKVKILQAVIRNYLETGEPVGSRTISKYTDLNLSSATIRNEMADLEEMGYIVQPHTSAGRIPTDKGYRLYVDDLMKEKVQELDNREKKVTERENLLFEKVDKVETLLQNMAKMLATNTNYATMISTSRDNEDKIKFIQLSLMDDNQILCIVVSGRNRVVNKIIKVKDQINEEMVLRLNVALNTSLAGLAVEQINIAVISTLTSNAGEHKELVTDVLQAITEAIASEAQMKIYTSGATNILKYPELSDAESATNLLSTFEEKDELLNLVTESLSDDQKEKGNGIQVYIGNEAPVQTMKDCSIVTATYDLGEGVKGTIGIVGPKRMDYEKVVDNLRTLKVQLDDIFKKTGE
mgnify:CR=1 FL=1